MNTHAPPLTLNSAVHNESADTARVANEVIRVLDDDLPAQDPSDRTACSNGLLESASDFSHVPLQSSPHGRHQPKLATNAPGDVYEQEANRFAESVMAAPASSSQTPERIRWHVGEAAESPHRSPPSVGGALMSPGAPLEPTLRREMEQHFGHDFSHVRVHSDVTAAQSAREVLAHAYTVGHDIVFGAGQYAPGSASGRRLIAHELAHVVQQHGSASGPIRTALMRDAMSQEDIEKRMAELNGIINDLGFSAEQRQSAMAELAQLSQLVTKGGTAAGPSSVTALKPATANAQPLTPQQAAVLDIPRTASLDELVTAVRAIDELKRSDVASNLFTTSFRGQRITLTSAQVERVRASARKALSDALDAAIGRRDLAIGRYRQQERSNRNFPVSSAAAKAYAWISTFGNYSNPAESVRGQSELVDARAAQTRSAIVKGGFADAIRLLSEADAASERTSKIVTAYVDQLIEGAGGLATTLELTRDAAFLTVGVLAVVVTGGAALGLEAGVVGTGVGGLTVAQTATVVSVGAPIVANLGVAGMKLAAGDPVEWDRLLVETAVQIILAKFGGRLTAGLANRIAGNPATQTLARQAVATLASGAATHVVAQSFSVSVAALFEKYRHDKNVTWGNYVDALAATLSEPTGWFMVMLSSGVHLGAQLKAANAPSAQPVKPTASGAAPDVQPTKPAAPAVLTPQAEPAAPTGATAKPATASPENAVGSASQEVDVPASTKPTPTTPPPAAAPQAPLSLDERIAAAEGRLNPARQRTLEYQEERRAEGKSLKGGPIKVIWNTKENIWLLKRQRAYPGRKILAQAQIVGVKDPGGNVVEAGTVAGQGRTLDYVELRGSKVVGGELKSEQEFKASVKGGLKRSTNVAGEFRGKVSAQQGVEQRLQAEASRQGGKLVIRGINVMTEQQETIEVEPANYGSEVTTYTEQLPN